MIKLKVGLKQKKIQPLNINYRYELRKLCDDILVNEETKNNTKVKSKDILSISNLLCSNYEISGKKIVFKDNVEWYIKSKSYDVILQLVQGLFDAGSIRIGKAEFEIYSIEAKPINDLQLEYTEVS
jgi:Uncharacterized protein predicted to be involved in DNA repair (RAMP superfamily)